MIAHTTDFKNELFRFGRQYKNKIGFYDDLLLATESGDTLITEDNNELIAKSSNTLIKSEIDDTNIFSIKLITKGEILSTLMRELDFVSDLNLEIGKTINYKFGILVNNDYEYLDFGKFIIYNKEYQNDTQNYAYTCYDSMLKTMIKIGNEFTLYGTTTGGTLMQTICNILSIDFDSSLVEQDGTTPTPYGMIASLDYSINLKPILEANITYRDLLNSLCQYFGVSMYMNVNELKIKLLGNIVNDNGTWKVDNENITSVDTIDERPFKDKNVTFKDKYGRINALNMTGIDGNKSVYLQDNQTIGSDELTLFEVKNNLILNDTTNWNAHSVDIANNIFNMINGVNFNLCDFASYGILYLEWLDYYTANINGNTYKGLLLNSEITIKTGIEENIYTEQPEKHVSEYTTTPASEDVIADTIRARGNAYANGERLVQESELNKYSNYTLQESDTGKTWIDGKKIYRKVIYFGALPNATTKNVLHNIDNLDEVINITGNFKDNSNVRFSIPYIYPDLSFASYYITFTETTDTQIGIVTGVDRSSFMGYVIIEYTKTSDL